MPDLKTEIYSTNLPQYAYTAQQVQQNEAIAAKENNVAMFQLMQNAGAAVFSVLYDKFPLCSKVLVIAGKGNNAGDGYILAKLALAEGMLVTVFNAFPPSLLKGDAKTAFENYISSGGTIVETLDFSTCDIVIDALLGTGIRGVLTPDLNDIIASVNDQNLPILSIDVPSGLNATSGEVLSNVIEATCTVTFIALKQGLLSGVAKSFTGTLYFAGLGIAEQFASLVKHSTHYYSEKYLLSTLPKRAPHAYKNQLGHVLCIGGGKGMAGAIRLASEACLRSGTGLVSVATHPDNVTAVIQGRYELMVHGVDSPDELKPLIEKATVILIGPGLGLTTWSKMMWHTVMQFPDKLTVIDADALTLLAIEGEKVTNSVITPHNGEARRLLRNDNINIENHRFDSLKNIQKLYQATVVLKGPGSLIFDGENLNINRSGCNALASAGMGDVLSGIIAALLAQGLNKFDAANLAVYIHGLAAENMAIAGGNGLLASDLFSEIRRLLG